MSNWVTLAVVLVAAAAVTALLGWETRRRAERIERSQAERADKVHRLRRLNVSGMVLGATEGVLAAATPWVYLAVSGPGGKHPLAHRGIGILAFAVVISLVCYLLPFFAIYSAIRPSYARVRRVPRRTENRVRGFAIGFLFGLVFPALWFTALTVAPRHGVWHLTALLLALVLSVFLLNGLLAPLLLVAVRARPAPPEARHICELPARMGVRLRDIRVFRGRQQKVANAIQIGILPNLRYVLISDYLISSMPPAQAEAIVAHELAHIRGRHILIKVGSIVAVVAVLEALAFGISALLHGPAAGFVGLALFIGLIVGLFVFRGMVGIRLELRADRVAAREVGRQDVIEALERLAELNDIRRRSGTGWSLLNQHPGIEQRIEELRRVDIDRVPASR